MQAKFDIGTYVACVCSIVLVHGNCRSQTAHLKGIVRKKQDDVFGPKMLDGPICILYHKSDTDSVHIGETLELVSDKQPVWKVQVR